MTSGVTIIGVPKSENEKSFILMVTESKAVMEDGRTEENDQKIFKAGNLLMTTGGADSSDGREWLANKLEEFQHKTIDQKNSDVFHSNQEHKNSHNINMVVVLAQFDSDGKPAIAANYVGGKGDINFGVFKVDESKREFEVWCSGDIPRDLEENLKYKLSSETLTLEYAIECAKDYVLQAAERNPEYSNKNLQQEVLMK